MMSEQTAESRGPTAPEPDEAVFRALSALSERDREALLLVGWEGLKPAQAARVLGVRPNTFAARLYRARRRLARALAGADADAAHTDNHCGSVKAEALR